MAFLAITEFDTYGNVTATQQVPINVPSAPLASPPRWGVGWANPSSGNLSAPFNGQTVMVALSVNQAGAQATVTFGQNPTALANGIPILAAANPTLLAVTGGERMAVL